MTQVDPNPNRTYAEALQMMGGRNFAAEQLRIKRQQALAQMLTQQGAAAVDPARMAGRFVVKQSPIEGLGRMAQMLGGALIEKDADKDEVELAAAQNAALVKALASYDPSKGKAGQVALAGTLSGIDPALTNQLLAKALEPTKYGTTPQTGVGADGNPAQFLVGEDGSTRQIDFKPRDKVELAPGSNVAYNPYEVKPGTVLPGDPEKLVTLGPDGKPVVNQAALGAKTQVAAAGATRVNTNVIPNTVGGEIGKAAIGDLSARRTQAQTAASGISSANRVMQLIDSGQIIAGAGAGAVTTLAKYLPVGGKDFREKLANTQTLMADLAKSALALKDQMPGPLSNADIGFLQRAAAGDINLEPAAIRRVAELNAMANSRFLDTFNRDVQATTGFLGDQGMGSLPFDYTVQAPAVYERPQAPQPGGDDLAARIAAEKQRRARERAGK